MSKSEKRVRLFFVVICEIFTLFSTVKVLATQDYKHLPICLVTFVLILLPEIVGAIFSCGINTGFYTVCVLYAIGPMLGDCYRLYYLTDFWDAILHCLGGIVFFMFGVYIYELLSADRSKILACAVFALCFSIALAGIWEFVEFGCDRALGMDMQQDTVVFDLNSYHLGEKTGYVGSIRDIESVIINGQELNLGGYLDIGLIDTMTDVLIESAGALVAAVIYCLDKGRHPVFTMKDKDN